MFSGTQQENKERRSALDRKIPPQKTQSSTEKERSQSWIRRQFSRKMSWDDEFSDADYAAAVAAAAFAIHSLEESKQRIQDKTTYGPDKSMNKMKSKAKDTGILPEPRRIAPKISDETSRQSFKDPDKKMPEKAPSVKKKASFSEINETGGKKPDNQAVEKAPERGPSMGRPPTFANKRWDTSDSAPKPDRTPTGWSMNPPHSDSRKPETPVPKLDRTPTGWSMDQPVETRRQSVRIPGPRDYVADAWTKEEMASIKERYEMLRATIDKWEAKKKMKANLKMEKTEANLEKRRAEAVQSGKMEMIKDKLEKKRAKAVKSYRSKIARVEEIAAGARAEAEESRRNEEFKVKEKANRIRLTGELPRKKCLCF